MGAKGVFTKENLLSLDEIKQLKDATRSVKERLVVVCLLYTGMRVGEFVHLRKGWIRKDVKGVDVIRIPKTQPCGCAECSDKRNKIWKPKSAMGARDIPMLPTVFPLLSNTLAVYFNTHKSVIELIPDRSTAWKILQEVGKRTDIPKIYPHALRGTYAFQVAKYMKPSVQDELKLCQIMGWANIKVAQEYIKYATQDIADDMIKNIKPW